MRFPIHLSLPLAAAVVSGCAAVQPDAMASRAKADVRSLFTADDYPSSALRRGEQGTVQARLTVGTDGRVKNCDVIVSSGSSSLDTNSCRILVERAQFVPARNRRGDAIEDSVTTPPLRWQLPASDGSAGADGKILNLDNGFRLYVAYGRAGRIDACKVTPLDHDIGFVCGPYLQIGHRLRRWPGRLVSDDGGDMLLFERGIVREEADRGLPTAIAGTARMVDREEFRIVADEDGEVTSCVETMAADAMYAQPDWACDEFKRGELRVPCADGEGGCAGAWVHYRYVARLAGSIEEMFEDHMRFNRPRAEHGTGDVEP